MYVYVYLLTFPASQTENRSLQEQISSINKELEITKEKLKTLEQAWENAGSMGKQTVALVVAPLTVIVH